MRKFFKTSILALALLATPAAFAQVSHGGEPLFNHAQAKATTNTRFLPTLDNNKYIQQDLDNVKGAGPMRISIGQACDINFLADAHKSKDANGVHYVLAVQSPDAKFISLDFSKFDLAEGAELFIYDETGEFVLGKYIKSDVMNDGRFFTQAIPGSTAYIEYNVPADFNPGEIQISSVLHGYKDIFQVIDGIYSDAEATAKGQHGNAEGDCHFDVKCPLGEGWEDQIRATVAIEIRAYLNLTNQPLSFMCSGSLINNTRQDRTPYVLSAYHCQDADEMIADFIAQYPNLEVTRLEFITYFLYQKYQCNGNTGRGNYSVTGAEIVAKYDNTNGSDMLLLRLNDTVPFTYQPYFAGWDRSSVLSPEPGACIHHPGGDFKKISIPKSIHGSGKFYEVHWFDNSDPEKKGITEQGSSGSSLFNADKRIIGQLFAGASYCNQPNGADYYGRLSSSWNGGGANTNRLKDWLDPDNTGVMAIDGLDYQSNSQAINVVNQNNKLTVYPNPTSGIVNFDINYIGMAEYKVFDLSGRCVKEGTTVLTSTLQSIDLRSLSKGSYTISLFAGSKTYSAQIIKK